MSTSTEYRVEPDEFGMSAAAERNGAGMEGKLRGGYYTPEAIGMFLSTWAVVTGEEQVLEPSAGDGALVRVVAPRLSNEGAITAVEWHRGEASKLRARGLPQTEVVRADFFSWYKAKPRDGTFDVAIANPPFIRYHDFPEDHRTPAFELMREEGLRPTRLTNAWVPFLVAATRALRDGGRLAFVLPAELLQVGYAAEIRQYLARKFSRMQVITFRRLVFESIQQETILLLGVREDSPRAEISFTELDDLSDLTRTEAAPRTSAMVDLDHAREKWTQFYLRPVELDLVRGIETDAHFAQLGEYAAVDVGVVTGRNQYFVMSNEDAVSRGLEEYCVPLVGRSAQIPGLALREADWANLAASNERCLLLNLKSVELHELSPWARNYVQRGELAGVNEGYKCRIRSPRWWRVPSVWSPDAFMLRQIHDGPRIVANLTAATCTDTIHRVKVKAGIDPTWMAAASVNSLTFAFAEIRGRSYGGGVLELEPSEAESLPIPRPNGYSLPLAELDDLSRSRQLEPLLDFVDERTLRKSGLAAADVLMLRGIWERMYARRKKRKRS